MSDTVSEIGAVVVPDVVAAVRGTADDEESGAVLVQPTAVIKMARMAKRAIFFI